MSLSDEGCLHRGNTQKHINVLYGVEDKENQFGPGLQHKRGQVPYIVHVKTLSESGNNYDNSCRGRPGGT